MALIQSISGIRGTIGGTPGENLTPTDIVKFAAAYAAFLSESFPGKKISIVIGRDARISGPLASALTTQTLLGSGIDVIDLGLSTTPTVEMAVPHFHAQGGIIITASHNPGQWNALKLLNHHGEFISAKDGLRLLEIAENQQFHFADVSQLGQYRETDFLDQHIEQILALPLVQREKIAARKFKVVVDAVNSSGGIAVPALLEKLGVEIVPLYCEPNGIFPHNPEPLPEHLQEISALTSSTGATLGIVVDPDVDRLAFICEDGSMFGEEYTLVAIADYILSKNPGNTVSNLSSTRALRDITLRYGGQYTAAAVGEVNVVVKMKETNAVIGGEGNGGIIYPELHYGRDALVGIALFLSYLAEQNTTMTALKKQYPAYYMAKKKVELTPGLDTEHILSQMAQKYARENIHLEDGVKIDFQEEWVHLRRSNTEPIIRVYTEAGTQAKADELGDRFLHEIQDLAQMGLLTKEK